MQVSKLVIALALLAALFGCSAPDRSPPPAPSPSIGLTASKSTVVANAQNSVDLTVWTVYDGVGRIYHGGASLSGRVR